MIERRKAERRKEEDVLVIYIMTDEDPIVRQYGINALSIDISMTGVRFLLGKSMLVNTPLKLEIHFDNQGFLQVEGNVRWISKKEDRNLYDVGVEFRDRSAQFIDAMQRHMVKAA